MSDDEETLFETEQEMSVAAAAQRLREVADGLEAGALQLGRYAVTPAQTVTLEEEYSTETDEDGITFELRLELKWETPQVTDQRASPHRSTGRGSSSCSRTRAGKFRFRLKAGNGEIIASSEAYESKAAAQKGIKSVRTNTSAGRIDDPSLNLRVHVPDAGHARCDDRPTTCDPVQAAPGSCTITRMIRTPDQRLRVFVSSTLKELADERAAVAAVSHLRLVPVMFELGARPHPPADLYRAYLEPEPRVRRPLLAALRLGRARHGDLRPRGRVAAGGRPPEARLHQGAGRRARAAARRAARPDPRRQLHVVPIVPRRRRAARAARERPGRHAQRAVRGGDPDARRRSRAAAPARCPAAAAGRRPGSSAARSSSATVQELIVRDDTRLVTVTGTGGSGKTRLAVELATALRDDLGWQVRFVDLTGLRSVGARPADHRRRARREGPGEATLIDAIASVMRGKAMPARHRQLRARDRRCGRRSPRSSR